MNTRAAGRGTTTGGHRGHDRRRDDRGSRRRAWEARDDAGRDLPTGVHLDQVRDLSEKPRPPQDARRPKPTARSGRREHAGSGAWDHYGGHRGHDRRRDDRGSRWRAWEARDDAGRDLPTGVHLDQVRDLSGEPDHVGEPVVDRLQHGPVSSGWTVFRPAAGEPVVDRLQHRSSSSKRRKPSAHERTEHHVPPGDVDLPGLWTPAHRRAESGGRRGGRPQAVGISRASAAAHACAPAARFPQFHNASSLSIIGYEPASCQPWQPPVSAGAGAEDDEGVISQSEYTLTSPRVVPNTGTTLTGRR